MIDGHASLDPREVGARQRRQGDLVVPGPGQAVAHHPVHLLGRALAHGPGDHPGLAEPTPPRASPEDLDVEPVVDHLDQRHELLLGVRPLPQVGDGALLHTLGHAPPARSHPGQAPSTRSAARSTRARRPREPGPGPGEGRRDAPAPDARHVPITSVSSPTASSPSPRTKASTKSARGSGLKAQWPPATTRGCDGVAVRAAHRHPGQVDQVEDVGVGQLGREVEGQHVEVRRRQARPPARTAGRRRPAWPPPCRSTGRRRARPRRRSARSGSRRGSGGPGWAARSRRCRGRASSQATRPGPWTGRCAPSSPPM